MTRFQGLLLATKWLAYRHKVPLQLNVGGASRSRR
jgi:hypothetical protein